ncbi:hypothetical protein [Streptomyces olivaceiscleroticus]|uniref:PH domain-containing protein n=1 Tax=Streptomyces olivaceiscleroticus TaxID=68245 RepID=A0ABP3KBJ6_9ACTN
MLGSLLAAVTIPPAGWYRTFSFTTVVAIGGLVALIGVRHASRTARLAVLDIPAWKEFPGRHRTSVLWPPARFQVRCGGLIPVEDGPRMRAVFTQWQFAAVLRSARADEDGS